MVIVLDPKYHSFIGAFAEVIPKPKPGVVVRLQGYCSSAYVDLDDRDNLEALANILNQHLGQPRDVGTSAMMAKGT